MKGDVIEQKQDGITFYTTPQKIVVCTGLQVFLLTAKSQYTVKPHAALREQIELGDIKNLLDLCGAMEAHIVMVRYRKEWI